MAVANWRTAVVNGEAAKAATLAAILGVSFPNWASVVPRYEFVYGSQAADAKANWRIGPDGLISHRYRATQSSPLTKIRWSQRWGSGSGYSGGTGGSSIELSLQKDDGTVNHRPDGVKLATLTFVPGNQGGADTTWFNEHTFTTPYSCVAGQLYHIVYTNLDASPTVNFMSVNEIVTLVVVSPRSPHFPDTDYAVMTGATVGAMVLGNGGGSWIADMDLTYANGEHDGLAYIEAMGAQVGQITGALSMVRQRFTVTGENRQVFGASIRANRVSGTDVLTVRLETGAGALIDTFDIASASIPIAATPTWASGTFPTQPTLVAGQTYNLRLSCAGTSVYTMVPIRDGTDTGDTGGTGNPTGFRSKRFTDGTGQKTTDGSNYADMYAFSPQHMQFYFTLA